MNTARQGKVTAGGEPETVREFVRDISANDQMKREVLIETLDSVRRGEPLESGRRVCGWSGEANPPLKRRNNSVEFRVCPMADVSIVVHSHATPREMLEPSLSLVDISSVAAGQVDALGVVGAEHDEYVFRSPGRNRLAEAFQRAVGLNDVSPQTVQRAIEKGKVDVGAAHDKIRRTARENFIRVNNTYADVGAEVKRLNESSGGLVVANGHYQSGELGFASIARASHDRPDRRVRRRARRCAIAAFDPPEANPQGLRGFADSVAPFVTAGQEVVKFSTVTLVKAVFF
jgi:hypothetical protein